MKYKIFIVLKMKISIDYDDTYTKDPLLWNWFAKEAMERGERKEQQGGGQAPINAVLIKTKHRYYFQANGS